MSQNCSHRLWLPGCVLALALVHGAHARAQTPDPKDEAQALIRAGFEHVYEGEHALALEKFERAHEIYPSPKILLNIGTTLKKLGRYAQSADTYEAYLRHPEADPDREAEVRRELDEVEARVGRLRIDINVDGAHIVVDGKTVELDARSTVRVDPGSHTVVVEKDGYESKSVSAFDVKPREIRSVRIGLVSNQARIHEQERARAEAFEIGHAAAIQAVADPGVDTGGLLGVAAGVAIAVQEPATSAIVGASYGVLSRLDVEAIAVLGGEYGAYVGARLFVNTDRIRLSASTGLPAFFIDGVRPGVRAGLATSVLIGDHIGVNLDLGVEHYFDLPEPLERTLVVPRLVLELRR